MKEQLLTRTVPTKVFFNINNDTDSYMHDITRKTGITYAHINVLVKKFIKWELVARENKNRIVKLTLTVKGKEISKRLRELHKALGGI